MTLPTPKRIKQQLSLTGEAKGFVEESRQTLRRILAGKDPRIALVVGPCSIHDLKACQEYAKKFKALAQEVEKSCFLVMRTYLQKPRTVTGWKGFLNDPRLDGSNDIHTGILWSREFLLELTHNRVPTATEFLDPLAALFFDDLITWGFIGARTSASQTHRELASLLTMPIGFKNGTDGDVDQAIHGVISARSPHTFLHVNEEGRLSVAQSEGNPSTHIVLRGSSELPNYDEASVQKAMKKMHSLGLKTRLLIDCSHGNSQKIYLRQQKAFEAVLEQILEGNRVIMGMMLESHLEAGSQFLSEDPSSLKFAVSVTDSCIDWSMTEELVRSASESINPLLK
jgi:3-deoxy-7-phosphoheptulonate synthase